MRPPALRRHVSFDLLALTALLWLAPACSDDSGGGGSADTTADEGDASPLDTVGNGADVRVCGDRTPCARNSDCSVGESCSAGCCEAVADGGDGDGAGDGGGGGCGGVTFEGECDGAIVRWCQDDAVQTIDCADFFPAGTGTCAYIAEGYGYFCALQAGDECLFSTDEGPTTAFCAGDDGGCALGVGDSACITDAGTCTEDDVGTCLGGGVVMHCNVDQPALWDCGSIGGGVCSEVEDGARCTGLEEGSACAADLLECGEGLQCVGETDEVFGQCEVQPVAIHVRDAASGNDKAGVELFFYDPEGALLGSATTDDTGIATWDDMPVGGGVTVIISTPVRRSVRTVMGLLPATTYELRYTSHLDTLTTTLEIGGVYLDPAPPEAIASQVAEVRGVSPCHYQAAASTSLGEPLRVSILRSRDCPEASEYPAYLWARDADGALLGAAAAPAAPFVALNTSPTGEDVVTPTWQVPSPSLALTLENASEPWVVSSGAGFLYMLDSSSSGRVGTSALVPEAELDTEAPVVIEWPSLPGFEISARADIAPGTAETATWEAYFEIRAGGVEASQSLDVGELTTNELVDASLDVDLGTATIELAVTQTPRPQHVHVQVQYPGSEGATLWDYFGPLPEDGIIELPALPDTESTAAYLPIGDATSVSVEIIRSVVPAGWALGPYRWGTPSFYDLGPETWDDAFRAAELSGWLVVIEPLWAP